MSKVFQAGDKVIDGSEPFVIQIDDSERDQRCHYCFIECDNLKKCSNCHQVKYCSKECQLKDWKDIHKYNECKLLRAMEGHVYSEHNRLIMRLVLKVTFDQKSRQKVYKLWDNKERKLDDLVSHHDKFYESKEPNMIKFCRHLIDKFDKLFNVHLDMDELKRLICIIKINVFTIGDSFCDSYATGLYIDGSALDHDCHPSCVRWYYGRKLQIRAMRTIDTAVEQPTTSYLYFAKDRDTRRRQLAERYFFECQCKRCVNYEDKDIDL